MRASLRTSWLAGVAVALIGLACSAVSLGARPPSGAWTLPAVALLVGATLLAAGGFDPSGGLYGGVITRLAPDRRIAWACRAAVLVTAPLAGAGPAFYAGAALFDALRGDSTSAPVDWRTTAGTGMLALSGVLAAGAAHLTVGGSTVLWAILLIASGLALFWGAAGILRARHDHEAHDHTLLRTSLGLALTIGGVVLVVTDTLHFHHVGATVAATATTLAVLALVIGPWWLRTRRLLEAERIERVRAQERAELADQLHDSVLQTLALIQRRAGDPAAVTTLARRQERDLRDWLLGRSSIVDTDSLASSLRAIAAAVEDQHGAEIEVVSVGDAPVDARVQALLAATREALLNAARHAPGAPVSVFVRCEAGRIAVYVHDRGPGFDPDAIPAGRHGVRDSIVARMHRNGGDVEIRSAPGAGCEVVLSMERR
jgi:signal transduction histidine kinase